MDWSIGYHSNLEEGQIEDLKVVGKIPSWLSGTLMRNGPAEFEMKNQHLNHWFDGFAKIHAVKFNNGKPLFYNRKFLKGTNFLESNKSGYLQFDEFGTNSKHPVLNRLRSFYKAHLTDNSSVNLYKLANKYVAFSETPNARIEFDPNELSTIGHFKFHDQFKEHLSTGHFQYDPHENKYYGYSTKLNLKSSYKIYSIDEKAYSRDLVAKIQRTFPSYMHSMALSENWLCLTENPVKINPFKIIISSKTLSDSLKFDNRSNTQFTLIHKKSGKQVVFYTKPFFTFHYVNMYEKGNTVILDLIEHAGLSFIKAMELKTLTHNHVKYNPGGKLVRYILDLDSNTVERKLLLNGRLELPTISCRILTRDYQYVYLLNANKTDIPYDEIVKYDLHNHTTLSWFEDNCFPSEVVFVPAPNVGDEDEGVLLSFVVDVYKKESFVLILDAKNLVEKARVIIPEVIPFGSHGAFFI
jgi:carotenoid cleavage dioxygenase-like enzyme